MAAFVSTNSIVGARSVDAQKAACEAVRRSRVNCRRVAVRCVQTDGVEPDIRSPLARKIKAYYDAWNERDFERAAENFSENIVIYDMMFNSPVNGREEAMKFLTTCDRVLPASFKFVLDDVTDGAEGNVATKFHIESNGQEVSNSRGVGFYIEDETGIFREYLYVESPIKPGGKALPIMKGLFTLLHSLPKGILDIAPEPTLHF
mmetsp:Transcript_4415/g.13390  ORF Transcript_4415/g.13390 Transcript_4415/m.13390 type:complete len:204 (-) Transcript_4415:367-978(-)|eukprot:CAMPEP_0198729150 /NCGR_PEP_ID=MMETSP1475-20131203/14905_1 /TAXON_ID= ORGANISM="Unidentified sp., Strain CCMP1999" /NCGR_SAMPLE_ID=MMETSP1475 /ASSEMBLY_ACC=CAM_ASM_001111 /LENGTH=203 /DNA_ID=CAMNT_0044491719 /DNA_START=107 /DNA_END=718 /DNA_ORIENTATION=-